MKIKCGNYLLKGLTAILAVLLLNNSAYSQSTQAKERYIPVCMAKSGQPWEGYDQVQGASGTQAPLACRHGGAHQTLGDSNAKAYAAGRNR